MTNALTELVGYNKPSADASKSGVEGVYRQKKNISNWKGKARPHGFLWGLRRKRKESCETYQQHKFFTSTTFLAEKKQRGKMAYILPSTVQDMPLNQDSMPMQVVTHVPQRQAVYMDVLPSDHIVWSAFHFIYCNPLCLGLVAFIYSIKSRDRKLAGDYIGARSHASTARCLNILALFVTLLITALVFIQIYFVIMAMRNGVKRFPWS